MNPRERAPLKLLIRGSIPGQLSALGGLGLCSRTLGAAGGVDLEAVLHLAHLHARGTQAPSWVVPLAWQIPAAVSPRQRAGERWSKVALDGEPLGMRSS
jgi:hypothetical protein